jgi:hypothetical protein
MRAAMLPLLSAVQARNSNVAVVAARRALLAATFAIAGVSQAKAQDGSPASMQPPDSAAVRAATEEKVRSLTQELARTARAYGEDSVALQASLLLQSTRAGAVAASEVKVAGVSPREGREFLEIDVGTGLIFDSDLRDVASCNEEIWSSVVAPVLEQMDKFAIDPAGLEIVVTYGRQHFSAQSDRKADPTAPQEAHTVRFVLPATLLDDLAVDRISTDEARAACRTAVDDTEPFGITVR